MTDDPPYPPGMLRAADIRWTLQSTVEQSIADIFDHADAIDVPYTVAPLEPPAEPRALAAVAPAPRVLRAWRGSRARPRADWRARASGEREPGEEG